MIYIISVSEFQRIFWGKIVGGQICCDKKFGASLLERSAFDMGKRGPNLLYAIFYPNLNWLKLVPLQCKLTYLSFLSLKCLSRLYCTTQIIQNYDSIPNYNIVTASVRLNYELSFLL